MSTDLPSRAKLQTSTEIPFWRDERVLRIVAQVISAIVIISLIVWVVSNVVTSANQRGLSLGFSFLKESAGFPLGETLIPYTPSNSFLYAFWVGVLNTLFVSAVGIVFATLLGTFVGLARLSSNWLVSRIALTYIEIHRNIPLLVLLFLWYSGVFIQLPKVQNSIRWPGPIYINQRGLYLTWPHLTSTGWIFLIFAGIGVILAIAAWIWLRRLRETTGRTTYFGIVSPAILLLFLLVGWLMSGGDPFNLVQPTLTGFNFQGGVHLTPEFTALLIGLVTYTAAFIAEVVRAGIQAVDRGQLEAAGALGLNYFHTLGLVIMPQALRVIIPPLISQYLNLTKNSSLAFFIGYPDLFFVGRTTTNQAGRAIQVFLLIMATYLVISLFTSAVLNFYNRRIQLVGR